MLNIDENKKWKPNLRGPWMGLIGKNSTWPSVTERNSNTVANWKGWSLGIDEFIKRKVAASWEGWPDVFDSPFNNKNKQKDDSQVNRIMKRVKTEKDDERKYPLNTQSPNCPGCGSGPGGSPGGGPFGCPGPGCGDGGGPGGSFGGGPGGGFGDSFRTVEKKLGGIRLDVEPQVAEDLRIGALKGVFYDPESKKIVLIGNQNLEVPSIRIGDLAEALALVYNPKINGQLQFSLDPDDPKNPKGEWLKAVYIPKDIQGTEIGRIMFETDWLLKQYSFGVKVEGKRIIERKTQVQGYKNIADIMLDNPSVSREPLWARMWIVEKNKKIKLHKKGHTVYIEEPEMIVKAKRQVPDPNSKTGLRDVESDNPSAKEFAKNFTQLYDKFAIESPEFGRLKEYTKTLVVAMWLKDMNFPYDYDWINKNLYRNKKYTQRVGTISWEKQRRREYPVPGGIKIEEQSVYLFGGVDARVKPEYVEKKDRNFYEKASRMDTIVQKELANGLSGRFTFSAGNKNFTGIVIPLEKQQKKVKPKIIEVEGTRYEFGENGKVVKSISPTGSTASYSYNPAGNLKAMDTQNSNGWKLNGKKNGNGSIWKITKPDSNTFSYSYDKSGYLNKFEVNGEKWAEYKYNKKRNEVNVRYADYAEKIHYDSNKNITEYEVKNLTNHNKEKIKFAYHKAGNLSDITIANKSLVNISYQRDSIRPTSITTPRAEINYSYDNNGSLQKIAHSSGISAAFQYENNQIKKLNLSYKKSEAEYLYDSNGIIRSKNLSGLITDYRYKNGRISSVATNQYGKAEYIYDAHNRMQEIHFPNGSWIEYKYREKISKKDKKSSTYALTTIYHPKATVSSSPITSKKTNIKNVDISPAKEILKKRLEDDITATKNIENSVVLDLFIENDFPHLNVVNSKGQIQQIDLEMAKKFRKLINLTSKTRGKLGRTLIKRWENFYNNHLASMGKPSYQKFHNGKEVKLKPVLIIKSNEVNYKYSNIEKVPALTENFIVFIASKSAENMPETSAETLIRKINNIPRLSRENIVFTITPPEMTNILRKEWENTVAELQKIVGKKNVLFNPTKQEFGNMLSKRKKDIVVIELNHTDKGIALKGNEIFSSKDILKGKDLSHIKYLLSGLGTCNLPQLEEGKFEASLRQKGVGIINGSYREVKGDIALKRLKMLIEILKHIEKYDLPAYYIHDIIDQLLEIIGRKTIHLGKLELYKKVVYHIV